MKRKNKLSLLSLAFVLMLCILLLNGCSSGSEISETAEEVNSNIDISGIQLEMDEKAVIELLGEDFEKSPCIIGYEYAYSDPDVNLGIDIDAMCVKRITSRSPECTVYSIPVGIKCTEGSEILYDNGFENDGDSKFKFVREDVRITMLSADGEAVDGFTVELIS